MNCAFHLQIPLCVFSLQIFVNGKLSVNLACAEENKHMLANHPGLLEEIIYMATTDPVPQAREHAATIIMVCSWVDYVH